MVKVIKNRKALRKKTSHASRKEYIDLIKQILYSKDFFLNLFNTYNASRFKTELLKISKNSILHIARSIDLTEKHMEKILNITRDNMKTLYDTNPWGDIWSQGWDDNLKMGELSHEMCNYIIIYEKEINDTNIVNIDDHMSDIGFHGGLSSDINVLSFLSFRFELEDSIDSFNRITVGYMYELQSTIKGKGYGKLLLDILRFICQQLQVSKIMCTVLRKNIDAIRFYTTKCGFCLDKTSPTSEPYIILSLNTG
ncbi:GNAT-like acetyltransferase [Cryptosporidium canis]|uniref:N-alpha-acetyltransferase 40 n=1 Tax=Cryptosporidium canis TaxID=195482 RepID=A0A9D5DJ72_9CRYT|nr:GNAT-like acetyltransferase [Cryptosporidium canis]